MAEVGVVVHSDPDVLAHAVAARLVVRLVDAQAARGVASIVLTGGRVAAAIYESVAERVQERLTLRQGALTYSDARLAGYDAAVLMEVIEHVDPHRLAALEHSVFRAAHPRAVVVTTPNVEYNVRYPTLEAGRFRHSDHRFEWTRAEFRAWAERVAADHGYDVRFKPVGEEDPELGPATQLALFTTAKTPKKEEPADV